ncbi:MAG TPA: zinc ribbon domain-containing protein [Candidatus Limnocylindrales bacterium]|nr:zinc ribbon domain-containing protein [Candidatus Limnocylindrales bacterium]
MASETVICRRCGVANPAGDQFCGSCGAFLEWESDAAPEADTAAGPPPGGPLPAQDPVTEDWSGRTFPSPPITAEPPPPPPPPPPVPAPDAPQPMPGFTVCPTCGSGNPPGRTFCHSCGNVLAKAPTSAAGTGPKQTHDREPRRIPGWLPLAIAAGLVVGVVVILVTVVLKPSAPPSVALPSATLTPTLEVPPSITVPPPASGGATTAAGSSAPGSTVQLTLAGASASSVAADTPDMAAANVIDGRLDTRWQEAVGSAPGEWVEVTFATARLDYLVVYSGFQLSHDSFVATKRPQNVVVTVNGGSPVGFVLQDSELPQRIDIADTPGATVVRIQTASTYPAAASAYPGSPIDAATISEIRAFGAAGG